MFSDLHYGAELQMGRAIAAAEAVAIRGRGGQRVIDTAAPSICKSKNSRFPPPVQSSCKGKCGRNTGPETPRSALRDGSRSWAKSFLTYGQALYKATHQALSAHIARDLEAFVLDRHKARRFATAMPFLDNMRGPDHIASVALTCAIDQLSRRTGFATFCQRIGKAIEQELRLIELARQRPSGDAAPDESRDETGEAGQLAGDG